MVNTLEFQLKNQILSGGSPVVSDSRNMICARFLLDVEPKGSVTAIFCGPTEIPYCKLLGEDYVCEIPWEAMVLPNKSIASYFSVSLVIGERLTTSCAIVPLIPSGYTECETPQPPTPSVYEELLTAYQKTTDKLNSIPSTDQEYSPDSENPQSGIAVAEAIGSLPVVDQTFDRESHNPQSGIAVTEAMDEARAYIDYIWSTYWQVDYPFDSESDHAQSGRAVAEAINSVKSPIKTYFEYSDAGNTEISINLAKNSDTHYIVQSVNVKTANGDEILCDVSIYDATSSGSSGAGNVTVRLSEPLDVPIIIRVVYTEGVL